MRLGAPPPAGSADGSVGDPPETVAPHPDACPVAACSAPRPPDHPMAPLVTLPPVELVPRWAVATTGADRAAELRDGPTALA